MLNEKRKTMTIKKNKIAEMLFNIVLMAIGIYMIVEGRTYRGDDKYFPMIVGGLTTGTSIWMMIEDLRSAKSDIDLEKINFVAVGVTVAALFIYYFLFETIGYVLSTILLGVSIIMGLRYDSVKGAILWPIGFVTIVFVVFKILLKIPLPTLFL